MLDLLLPRYCTLCGCDAAGVVCAACAIDLAERWEGPYCDACGRGKAGDAECVACGGRGHGAVDATVRLGEYDPPTRRLLLEAKFRRRPEVAAWLGARLGGAAARRGVGADVVVPLPLHRRRLIARGYNQCEHLARGAAGVLGLPVARPIVRDRATAVQSRQTSVAGRRANVRDVFLLPDPAAVAGRRVLLVDDILTTGATLRSAARCLRGGNPTAIIAAVAAVATMDTHREAEELDA